MNYINRDSGQVINQDMYDLLSDLGKSKFTKVDSSASTSKTKDPLSKAVDFGISAAIGATTGSAILGGLFGGDIMGGVCGDLLDGNLWD